MVNQLMVNRLMVNQLKQSTILHNCKQFCRHEYIIGTSIQWKLSERVGSGKRCKRLRRFVNELSRDVDGLVDVEVYTLIDAVDKTLPSIIWTMFKYSHVSYELCMYP